MASGARAPAPAGRRAGSTASWWWRWGPVLAAMAAIFVASNTPNLGDLPGGMSDKTAHVLAYAGLTLLVLRATSGMRWSGVTARSALAAWLVAVGYGVSDEVHQRFVPGRTAALDDLAADAIGAALAVALVFLAARVLKRPDRAV